MSFRRILRCVRHGSLPRPVSVPPVIAALTLSPSLPAGQAFVPYAQNVVASGGVGPYIFSLTSGALPSGLSFNTSTGAITGTPTTSANYTFTIRVVDTKGTAVSQVYTISIALLVQFLTNPSISTDGTPIVGETATLNFGTIVGDTIGTRQIIDATNTVIATVTATSYVWTASGTFRLRVYGASSGIVAVSPTVSVGAAPTITLPGSLPAGTTSVAYTQTVAASGGTSPYTYAVISGALPTGVSLNTSTGALTGTPSAAATYNFTIRATDAGGYQGQQAYSVVISAAVLTLSPSSLPNPTQGTAYSQTITTTGGTSPYTYAVTSGALPTGLSLNTSTGAITGTPGAAAAFTFVITATDAAAATGNRSYTVTVQATGTLNPPTLTKTSGTGAAPFTWSAAFDATVYAGYSRHIQAASDSGFTSPTDYVVILDESSLAGLDQTISGFATLSGAMYVRERVERDDGTVSSWSNTINDTITAASMILSTTNGTDKSSFATVTGTPALTATSTVSSFGGQVRANRTFTGQRVFEVSVATPLTTYNHSIQISLDQSGASLGTSPSYGPGKDDATGVCYTIEFNGITKQVNSWGTGSGTTSYTAASGDIYQLEHDTATGSGRLYYVRSGSRTLLMSHTVATGAMKPQVSTKQSDNTLTCNFGQGTFAATPTSGYTLP